MVMKLSLPLAISLLALAALASAQQPATNFQWPEGKQVALSLSFDDARASQVERGAALLDRYNVKATFYVMPSGVERKLAGWRKVVASGHEIANHTLNHPCSGNIAWSRNNSLENYTLERMRQELLGANRRIQELLGVTPESFTYPCGQTFVGRGVDARSYVPMVASLFVSARGGSGKMPADPARIDFSQLAAVDSDGKDFKQIFRIVETAKQSGSWVVLAGHDMGEDGEQTTRLAMLEELIRYAQNPANSVWIAPVGRVAQYVHAQRRKKIQSTKPGQPEAFRLQPRGQPR